MSYLICADDYAQNWPITEGILQLLTHQKIQATTCMTASPLWPEASQKLKEVSGMVGLHFNLTHAFGRERMPSVSQLLLHCILRTVDRHWVKSQLNTQLDLFELYYDAPPAFIDGHQHIHHFPVIRDILVETYLDRYPDKKLWVRISANPWYKIWNQPKAWIIALSGAYALRRQLKQHHIPHNSRFSGIYDFSNKLPYSERFTKFEQEVSEDGLIMCHPGLSGKISEDPIADARVREYEFFLKRK